MIYDDFEEFKGRCLEDLSDFTNKIAKATKEFDAHMSEISKVDLGWCDTAGLAEKSKLSEAEVAENLSYEMPSLKDLNNIINEMFPMNNYESEDEMVSHPSHYQSKNGIEVIDVIAAFTDGLEGIEATDTGNAIKYLCRWKNKNGIQDLEKAIWYIQHLINVLKSKNMEE